MTGLLVDGVSVQFGGVAALDRVSLHVPASQITGLIGPNGAGKTTLFNVVCGLQRPAEGRILLDERDLTALVPHERARCGIARTFQRLELFGSLTVRENVEAAASMMPRLGRRDRRAHARAVAELALERVGLLDLAAVTAFTLPTGQGRLLELARALAIEPRVLLLDEPASGQEDAETATFAALVRSIAADGVAVLLVEHDVDLVMSLCDTVHVLDLGRVLASGPPQQVRNDPDVVAAYLGAGFTR